MVDQLPLTDAVRVRSTPSLCGQFHPVNVVFYVVFCLAFLLSGLITISGLIPYRMGLAALLIVPLLLRRGITLDLITIAYIALTFLILLSGIYNSSTVIQLVLFLRTLVFSYLSYYAVEKYANRRNIVRLVRLCVVIAVLQLPIVILQLLTYEVLPTGIRDGISPRDYDFGTFNYKGDSSMSFFIILVVVFILFDSKRARIIRHRFFVVFWLSATVFFANSELSKLTLIAVWGAYFVIRVNRRTTLMLMGALLLLGTIVVLSGAGDSIMFKLGRTIEYTTRGLQGDRRHVERFLRGDYSRGGAVYYYLNRGILWFGDGPSAYYDPISRVRVIANTGHAFTFYGEIGIFGLALSYVILALIAFPVRRGRLQIRPAALMGFMAILILSFTAEVLNDISFVLIYSIMAKAYLIKPPARRCYRAQPSRPQSIPLQSVGNDGAGTLLWYRRARAGS